MKPLISSCLMTTIFRGASIDWIWPCSVNTRCSGALLHAATATARPRDKTNRARISSSLNDLDRHIRLQLPGMERELLSRRSRGEEDAAVLRRAVSHRRDQLHVLPDAERGDCRRLGGADAVALQAHAEGAAPHHARQPAEKRRGVRRRVLPGGLDARRQARRAAVSAAAEPEEGPGGVRRV